jgi:hypothetical protein
VLVPQLGAQIIEGPHVAGRDAEEIDGLPQEVGQDIGVNQHGEAVGGNV